MGTMSPHIYNVNNRESMFNFEHIKHVGWSKVPFFRFKEVPYVQYTDQIAREILQEPVRTGIVRPTKTNYYKAVKAFDAPEKHPNNSFFPRAVDMVTDLVGVNVPMHRPAYDKIVFNNWNASNGWPWNLDFDEKQDVPLNLINNTLKKDVTGYIWCLKDKRERLPMDKITIDEKMRTFMMPPFPLLVYQKLYCSTFNDHLKNVPWVAYGSTHHYGEYGRLMEELAQFPLNNESDVRFWDKAYSQKMKLICAQIRRSRLILTREEEIHYWKVANQEIYPEVILPTGEIIKLSVGQVSGSENTTTDNTLAHLIMVVYCIIKNVYERYGYYPTWNDIFSNCFHALFGDDKIASFTEKYSFLGDPQIMKALYQEFGMDLDTDDPRKWRNSTSVIGVTFLGMTCAKYYGYYVWTYPWEKVVDATLMRESKEEDPQLTLLKFLSLLELLVFTDDKEGNSLYEKYADFIRKYCARRSLPIPHMENYLLKRKIELCLESWDGGMVNKKNFFIMNDEKSTIFPKTIRTINRINRKYNSQTPKSREKNNQKTRKGDKERYKKNNEESRGRKKEISRKFENRNRQSRSQNSRQRTKYVYNKSSRSSSQVGRGYRNTISRRQVIHKRPGSNRTGTLKYDTRKHNRNGVNAVRRLGYDTPMPFIQPFTRSTKNDGCVISGSEYIGEINVRTTADTVNFTESGDILKILYMNPDFMPGTRIQALSTLFQHYKFKKAVLEYIPDVSNFQPGSVGMAFVYDPAEPINLIVGTDERRRRFMALKGANLFKVADYGRVYLEMDEDTLKDYFIHANDEVRTEMQAYFIMMAFSRYSPFEEGSNTLTLGQLVLHYELNLTARSVDVPEPPISSGVLTVSGLSNTIWTQLALYSNVSILAAIYGASFSLNASQIVVLRIINGLKINSAVVEVDTPEGDDVQFFSHGSVWFGFVTNPIGDLFITTDLDRAIDRGSNDVVTWSASVTSTHLTTFVAQFEIYEVGALPSMYVKNNRKNLKICSPKEQIVEEEKEDDNEREEKLNDEQSTQSWDGLVEDMLQQTRPLDNNLRRPPLNERENLPFLGKEDYFKEKIS